jgi:hypothetical protein
MVKKFPVSYGTRSLISGFIKAHHRYHDEPNDLVHIFNIHFNIILPYKVNLDRGFKLYIKGITPWIWDLLEKIIVAQLVKKSITFYGTPKFHYRVHKSPALDPVVAYRPVAKR